MRHGYQALLTGTTAGFAVRGLLAPHLAADDGQCFGSGTAGLDLKRGDSVSFLLERQRAVHSAGEGGAALLGPPAGDELMDFLELGFAAEHGHGTSPQPALSSRDRAAPLSRASPGAMRGTNVAVK